MTMPHLLVLKTYFDTYDQGLLLEVCLIVSNKKWWYCWLYWHLFSITYVNTFFIKSFVGKYLPYEREKLYITWFMTVFLLLTNNVKLDFFQIVKGLKILALKDQKVGKIWEERHIKISNNFDWAKRERGSKNYFKIFINWGKNF